MESDKSCSFTSETIRYSSESGLQTHVKYLLEDMAKITGLEDEISIIEEISIGKMKADFLVVLRLGIPIGAIEVKKPGKQIFENLVYGQIFDYLLQLRSFHGVGEVFGILTNLVEWKIVWLPDTEIAGKAINLSYGSSTIEKNVAQKRELHVSDVTYTINDHNALFTGLTSVLKKMRKAANNRCVVPITSSTRVFIELSSESWRWIMCKSDLTLSLYPPSARTEKFLVLRDYHGGADGKVWLAATLSNRVVVLKIVNSDVDEQYIDVEIRAWSLCGFPAFLCRLVNLRCIVMQYALRVKLVKNKPEIVTSINDWTREEGMDFSYNLNVSYFKSLLQLVKRKADSMETILDKAIDFLANRKIAHLDIHWRHVALMPTFSDTGNKLTGYQETFIDLTRVKFTESKEEALREMSARVSELKDELLNC
jgi:hypothetical protein